MAGCDISLFDDCLHFGPYASIGLYHKAVIPFLEGDSAPRAVGCTILSARSATMVSSNMGMDEQSTVDSFTKRSSDAAAYAAGLAQEPQVDDFTDEGNDVTA